MTKPVDVVPVSRRLSAGKERRGVGFWRCCKVICLWLFTVSICPVFSQTPVEQPLSDAPPSVITTHSALVLVPVFVKSPDGKGFLTLQDTDFLLSDDGVPQKFRIEPDTDLSPLALVIVVQTGNSSEGYIRFVKGLDAVLDAIVGDVEHRVAIVSFDSLPHLDSDFESSTDSAARTLNNLQPGDDQAATLDALKYAVQALSKQPPRFRKAIVLISGTADTGSSTSVESAIRAVDEANVSIYSFTVPKIRAALSHEANRLPHLDSEKGDYSSTPYAEGGCMSRDPNADPDAHGNRSLQALDCAEDLFPPLRLARIAFVAARSSMSHNIPKTVARLTGGEYREVKNAASLKGELISISNEIHNQYVLSFKPVKPHLGLHTLHVELRLHPELTVEARSAYWFSDESAPIR